MSLRSQSGPRARSDSSTYSRSYEDNYSSDPKPFGQSSNTLVDDQVSIMDPRRSFAYADHSKGDLDERPESSVAPGLTAVNTEPHYDEGEYYDPYVAHKHPDIESSSASLVENAAKISGADEDPARPKSGFAKFGES